MRRSRPRSPVSCLRRNSAHTRQSASFRRWLRGHCPKLTLVAKRPISGKRQLKTLDRVISKAGLGSRTEARSWIGAGRVSVNGKVIQTPDHWVDFERDRVAFDGKPLRSQA